MIRERRKGRIEEGQKLQGNISKRRLGSWKCELECDWRDLVVLEFA